MMVEIEGALRPRSTSDRKPLVRPVFPARVSRDISCWRRSSFRRSLRARLAPLAAGAPDFFFRFATIGCGRRSLTQYIPLVNTGCTSVNSRRDRHEETRMGKAELVQQRAAFSERVRQANYLEYWAAGY